MVGNFESLAEERAFPYLKEISKKIRKWLEIQHSIKDWAYKDWAHEEWAEEWAEENEISITYSFEKYRLDFAFPEIKVGIEIDGPSYHDTYEDYNRDQYLKKRGWKIIRIKSDDVFSGKIKEILEKEFGFGQRNLMEFDNGRV